MVTLTKTHKFTLIVLGVSALILYIAWQTGTVSLDWNGMFNGTLQSIVGGFITMAMTIWVYRYLYHRKSKR